MFLCQRFYLGELLLHMRAATIASVGFGSDTAVAKWRLSTGWTLPDLERKAGCVTDA